MVEACTLADVCQAVIISALLQVLSTLQTIRSSGLRLLNLVSDILDAAAIRKGRLTVAMNKVNLGTVVQTVMEVAQPLAQPGVRCVMGHGVGARRD